MNPWLTLAFFVLIGVWAWIDHRTGGGGGLT